MTRDAHSDTHGTAWHRVVLADLTDGLAARHWCCELLLRGSLARGGEDSQSDIDLAVSIAEPHFEEALRELAADFPVPMPGLRRPWLDTLVGDFGGIGFVYLKEIAERKWGQIDIYLLPHNRRRRLLQHPNEAARSFRAVRHAATPDGAVSAQVDAVCARFRDAAADNVEQAIFACYVEFFLLRKRLVRHDAIQTFADNYAVAKCVRDFVYLVLAPGKEGMGWRDAADIAAQSSAPDLVMNVIRRFAGKVPSEPADLADRVAEFESILGLLVPAIWEEQGEALRSLGSYLASNR